MFDYYGLRQRHSQQLQRKVNPARSSQILVIGFALIIFLGTGLLKLPFATETPDQFTWLDALFTATSATTVTGLAVVPTATSFTLFGELVILGLIQIGGIGFIVLSVILFRLIGRRVTVSEREFARQSLGLEQRQGVVHLTFVVFRGVLFIELLGATVLFTQWVQVMTWPTALYYAIFHAISAFCNAGFDLFFGFEDPNLLFSRRNPFIIITFSLLIVLGSLGFSVLFDLQAWSRYRRISLHSRLILPLTVFLIVLGIIIVFVDETFGQTHLLATLPLDEKLLMVLFNVVGSRTAGITLLPLNQLGEATQLTILSWMFMGGAPASMAGGVGLNSIAVVCVVLLNNARGYRDGRVLGRTLPAETITKAIAVVTISTFVVLVVSILMLLNGEGHFLPVVFEVVSAYSNTGFSLGITDQLSTLGRLLLIFTMFWGRLGPLTLVVAIAQRRRDSLITYPEERILIG